MERLDIDRPLLGRVVQGDFYKGSDKDDQGVDRVYKSGKNEGQKYTQYFFALAIKKTPGVTHWGLEPWGVAILDYGRKAWPTGQAEQKNFAWKITDGDSTDFNEGTPPRRWCDHEGFPGHWVIKLTTSFAPKIYNTAGEPILEPGYVKRGYFVEVLISLSSNESQKKPGIHINPGMIAFRAYGPEIVTGPDPKSVAWGKSALPEGASDVPVGGAPANLPPGAGKLPPPGAGFISGAGLPPPPSGAAGAPPLQTSVVPSATFAGAPPAGAVPLPPTDVPPPPPPPVAPGPKMTPKASGATRESFLAKGWSDEQLVAHGYMVMA